MQEQSQKFSPHALKHADTAAVEQVWERSDEAERLCDVATKRLLDAQPESWGGLHGKVECVRWHVEARADRELADLVMEDVRRLAGV